MPALYILKAVCAFLIVFIHLPGIAYEAVALQPLMRIGVPVFLMISGYFLVNNNEVDLSRVKRQLLKICILTLSVYVVYFIFHIIRNIVLGHTAISPHWISFDWILRLVIFGDNVDSVLWYLTAYIEALVILLFLFAVVKSEKYRTIILFSSLALLIFAVAFNRYSIVFGCEFDIVVSRNALTVALPCICIGILTRLYENSLKRATTLGAIVMLCIFLAYAEYAILHIYDVNGSGADFNIMTFPLAFAVFLYCIVNQSAGKIPLRIRKHLVNIGKNNSADIYLYHSLVWLIIALLIYVSNNNIIRLFANAEVVFLIVMLFSYFKNSAKRMLWISTK